MRYREWRRRGTWIGKRRNRERQKKRVRQRDRERETHKGRGKGVRWRESQRKTNLTGNKK